jgi:hypothetical protein
MFLREELLQNLEVEVKDMKLVYLIFTLLLWCAIPVLGLFSLLGFIFFILGLLIVLKGRGIKH